MTELEGASPIVCPLCGQVITVDRDDDDKTECGGIGEGICEGVAGEVVPGAGYAAHEAAWIWAQGSRR